MKNHPTMLTRDGIFKDRFHCRIPYIQMLDADYLEHFGMPMSGDPVADKAVANELRDLFIPISTMVDYYRNGAQISIKKKSDTKEIYDRITAHLIAWKGALEDSLNLPNAPLEDLKWLDEFANKVYEHAKWQFRSEYDAFFALRNVDKAQQAMTAALRKMEGRPVTAGPVNPDMAYPEERQFRQRQGFGDSFVPRNMKTAGFHQRAAQALQTPQEEPGGVSKKSFRDLLGGLR